MNAIDYLEQYPLSVEQQELVDLANSGKSIHLVSRLNGAKIAIAKLQLNGSSVRAASREGLRRYYEGQLRALISLITDSKLRRSLENIYLGD